MQRARIVSIIVAASAAAGVSSVSAQLVGLDDLNSHAGYDLGTQAGQYNWSVNGLNHMFQQWFWYRADGDATQHSIDTLVPAGLFVTDTNPFTDPRPDQMDALWNDPAQRFNLDLTVRLRGSPGNTLASDITEQIRITNTTAAPLNYTLFQYVDLDLNGTPVDSLAQIHNGNTADQSEFPIAASETVVTPLPAGLEVNMFPNTLNALNGGLYNLNNNAGPLGPGDLTWAFQWNFVIGPGQSVIVSKDKSLTPTPGTATLLAMGGLMLGRRRRR